MLAFDWYNLIAAFVQFWGAVLKCAPGRHLAAPQSTTKVKVIPKVK